MLVPAAAAAEPRDLETYYPIRPHVVRWYAVKDAQSGAPIDLISFAIVARETGADGAPVYIVENRFSWGVSLDYQKATADQVQLDRLILRTPSGDVKDVRFTPALPMLRAPVDIGQTWSATPAGDATYTYRVESRFAMHVLGKDVPECVRVVRARAGTVDRKTDYCPGIGVAAIETLAPSGVWLRADIVAIAGETDLIAVKSSARVPGGCEYVFDPLGPDRGELTVTVRPPGRSPLSPMRRPANQNIHVGVPADAPQGQWRLEVNQSPRTALQTFAWSGTCRFDPLVPPPSRGPSVILVREQAEPGRATLTVVGVGWKPDEQVSLVVTGPGWTTVNPLVWMVANGQGASPPFPVTFPDTLPSGEFTVTMQGSADAAALTVVCGDKRAEPLGGYCAVKFWRRVMASSDTAPAAEPK